MRRYQPLIRFRLGDRASWSEEPCTCGRALPILSEVAGRVEDVVRGPDGRELVRFHGIFIDLEHIREGQIVQETLHHIRVLLVATADQDRASRERVTSIVEHRIDQRLGSSVRCQVEWVPRIERTAAGKFRAVISKLDSTQPESSSP